MSRRRTPCLFRVREPGILGLRGRDWHGGRGPGHPTSRSDLAHGRVGRLCRRGSLGSGTDRDGAASLSLLHCIEAAGSTVLNQACCLFGSLAMPVDVIQLAGRAGSARRKTQAANRRRSRWRAGSFCGTDALAHARSACELVGGQGMPRSRGQTDGRRRS